MQVAEAMQRQVATVADEDSLGLALQVMLWSGLREVPVLRAADRRLTGVIGERDILRAQQRQLDEDVMHRPVRDFMVSPPEQIESGADLREAAALLGVEEIGCLLVVDGGELQGLITASDVLLSLAQVEAALPQQTAAERKPERGAPVARIAELMHPQPITAREDDSLKPVATTMIKAGVRHACVVDAQERVVGILSDRDVRRAIGDPKRVLAEGGLPERLAKVRVWHAMTPTPRTIRIDEPLDAALDALLTQRFGALPVVGDDGRLAGIVSYIDVLRHLTERH
jgi:CBS domain-containing protein